jgi:hypothetical protein
VKQNKEVCVGSKKVPIIKKSQNSTPFQALPWTISYAACVKISTGPKGTEERNPDTLV